MENSKNSIFLHRFGCVSLGIKKFMKPRFTTFGVLLNIAVSMHPNGPKCFRNEGEPSLLGQDTLWVL